jgi:hypothetical protein
MFVVTADQLRSRQDTDRVPGALTLLAARIPSPTRRFERTVGDEIQGVQDRPEAVRDVVASLVRDGHWRIGVGIGPVEHPLPPSPREGRGPAFVAARAAVEAAHPVPGQLAVRNRSERGTPRAAREVRERHTIFAESALLLWVRMLRGRTTEGWEVIDLLTLGLTQREVAVRLEITPSAVSQRVRRAGWQEQVRGAALIVHHLSVADGRAEHVEAEGSAR